MKFLQIFFLSFFSLFIEFQSLQSSPQLNNPNLFSARLKSKNKFHSESRAKMELKFNNMAFSMKKLQELNTLHQNMSQEIQVGEEKENHEEQLLLQIKSINKQLRLNKKIIENTKILAQNAKTERLKSHYQNETLVLEQLSQNLNKTKKELTKLLKFLRTPKENAINEEIQKAAEDLNKVRSVIRDNDKKRKEKENKVIEKITRFVARKLKKGSKKLRSRENNGTIQSQIEASFLAKSTFLAFLYSQGSDFCLKQNLSSIDPTHCPSEYERTEDLNSKSVCRSLCPSYYSFCGTMCYVDCTFMCIIYSNHNQNTFSLNGNYYLLYFVTNMAFGPCTQAYKIQTLGTQCYFSYSDTRATRYSKSVSYIYNSDSRVLCTNPDYSFKNNDKCYKSCSAINMKDITISLCGKSAVAGSEKFDIQTLQKIRSGIDEGVSVNGTSTFSQEFLDFYANQFKAAAYSATMSSVITSVQGFDEAWSFKLGNASKSIMADEVAGRFTNNSYVEISLDMISNLKKWAKTADTVKSDAPKLIDFFKIAQDIKDCSVGCLNTEIQKVRCAKQILGAVIEKQPNEIIALARAFGNMECQKF